MASNGELESLAVRSLWPAARHVASYRVMGAPPSNCAGTGVYDTDTCWSAVGLAVTPVGAANGRYGTRIETALDLAEPTRLNARTTQEYVVPGTSPSTVMASNGAEASVPR